MANKDYDKMKRVFGDFSKRFSSDDVKEYQAGEGITITDDTIAIDNEVVAKKEEVNALDEKLSGDIENLDTKLSNDIENLDSKLSGDIENLDTKLGGDIENLDSKLSGDITTLDEKLSGDIENLDTKLSGDIEDLEREVENISNEVEVLEIDSLNKETTVLHEEISKLVSSFTKIGIIHVKNGDEWYYRYDKKEKVRPNPPYTVYYEYFFAKMGGINGGKLKTISFEDHGTSVTFSSANVIIIDVAQEKLESGTNLKTINNESLLGSGNINISSSGGAGEIADQYVRITDLESGFYNLTYNGQKYIYYEGEESERTAEVKCSNYHAILNVQKSYDATAETVIWNWWLIDGDLMVDGGPYLTFGNTNTVIGFVYVKKLRDLVEEDYLKTLNTYNSQSLSPDGSEKLYSSNQFGTIYLHKISKTGSYNDLLNKPTIPTKTSQLSNDSDFVTSSEVPSVSGTNDGENWTSITIDDSTYNIPQGGGGTAVIANPTLAGDEDDLTALQVGNTKYKVPSGGSGTEFKLATAQCTELPPANGGYYNTLINISEDAQNANAIDVGILSESGFVSYTIRFYNITPQNTNTYIRFMGFPKYEFYQCYYIIEYMGHAKKWNIATISTKPSKDYIDAETFDGSLLTYQYLGKEIDSHCDIDYSRLFEYLTSENDIISNVISSNPIYTIDSIGTKFTLVIALRNDGLPFCEISCEQESSPEYPFNISVKINGDDFLGHAVQVQLKDWGADKTSLSLGELLEILADKEDSPYIVPESYHESLIGYFNLNYFSIGSNYEIYSNIIALYRGDINDYEFARFTKNIQFFKDIITEVSGSSGSSSSSSS